MLKYSIRVLAVVSLVIVATHQFELDCSFERAGWDDVIGPAYACKVFNLNVTKPKSLITSLRGQHPAGFSNDNVNTFLVFEQICEYFPVGIEKNFNLIGLAVQKSGLKRITKGDLKPFGDLKSISLFGNVLTSLESDLFIFNPKLKLISFFNNHLMHVSGNVFDGISHLERAYFSSNPCINEDVLSSDKIEQLKCKLIESCPETYEMIEHSEIEADLRKMRESFGALSINLVRTRKKLQQNEERCRVQASVNDSESCEVLDVALKTCESEKIGLIELIQDMEIVEIVCESIRIKSLNEANQCNAIGLKVLKPGFKVVNVKSVDRNLINTELITELVFNNQRTHFLPHNISNFFTKLTKLTVTNCQLISINEEVFFGLHDLTEINFSSNQLIEIKSRDFNHFVKLLKLDLSHNRIDSIENSAFNSLANLLELRLNDNLLVKLDSKIIMSSKHLKILSLQNNHISQVASNFLDYCSKYLEIINLRNNDCVDLKFPTTTLEDIRRNFVTNCTIQINFECRFESRIEYFCDAENVAIESLNVKVVRVVGVHEPTKSNSNVAELRIINQTLEFIPQNLGKLLLNLEQVWIEGSKLKMIEKKNFEGFEEITRLTMRNNALVSISDETFDDLTRLEMLDLSINSIDFLATQIFAKLLNLKSIDLSHNKLTTLLSEVISPQNVIQHFCFDHNELKTISPVLIRHLRVAKLISFEYNKCIDSKYNEASHDNKKVMELFGEISFKCHNV